MTDVLDIEMPFKKRTYKSPQDLHAIGELLRRSFAEQSNWNAWNCARFDIWAQRGLADAAYFGNAEWQNNMALWEDENGELVGAAAFTALSAHRWGPNEVALYSRPGRTDVFAAMLDWADAHHAGMAASQADLLARLSPKTIVPHGPLAVEAMSGNQVVRLFLEEQGYHPSKDWMIKRFKTLDGLIQTATLPAGFVLKPLETPEEHDCHMASVNSVFSFQDTLLAYRSIQRAPSYVPSLDLILLAPDGVVAAFCTIWVDWSNRIGEFEPVGTHPDFRRRGLASALVAEACNRLWGLGIKTVGVESWSESPAANRLYDAAGLGPEDTIFSWSRRP